MKLNKENLSNKAFISVVGLVGISILSIFAHESSPVGKIGNVLFQYLTMPILAVGSIMLLWSVFKDFFAPNYFKKDFNLIVFICHLLWFCFVGLMTGLLCISVFKSYLGIFV